MNLTTEQAFANLKEVIEKSALQSGMYKSFQECAIMQQSLLIIQQKLFNNVKGKENGAGKENSQKENSQKENTQSG